MVVIDSCSCGAVTAAVVAGNSGVAGIDLDMSIAVQVSGLAYMVALACS
jgi:hypothetical protein